MEKIRIMLLGVGGNVSQGILKAIRDTALDYHIIGACISPDSEGLYLCQEAYLSPYAASERFLPWLYAMCAGKHIDIVFSGVEEVIEAIAPHKQELLKKTGAVFRSSTPDLLEIGNDKLLTCRWLREHGFRAPDYCAADNREAVRTLRKRHGYPLIAKPRRGKGSGGVLVIEEDEALERTAGLKDYVIQEYVGDSSREYTVGCYRALDGYMPPPIVMRRTLKNGMSWKTEVVESKEIQETAARICAAFGPDGPFNIQLRLDRDGSPVPFEFNVRFSGTTPIRSHFGFRDVEAMLYESVLKRDISPCFHVRSGVAYRYIEELYLDSVPRFDGQGKLI